MNRRIFLGTILGAGAAVTLPSEVWPFRKIFLPSFSRWFGITYTDSINGYEFVGLSRSPYPGRPTLAEVSAVELEQIAKQIPSLLFQESVMYNYFKSQRPIGVSGLEAISTMQQFKKYLEMVMRKEADHVDRFLQKPLRQVLRETDRRIKSGDWLFDDKERS